MRHTFHTTCVDSDGPSIDAMTDAAREVTRRTFQRRCDWRPWAQGLGYSLTRDGGLPLARDWHVAYFKSRYRGRPCYYAVHSAIEYIFVRP